MASDKNHRPCLPLKPQEKSLKYVALSLNSFIYRNYPAQNAIEAFNKMIGILITEQATKVVFF
jgi:hypothetical protein